MQNTDIPERYRGTYTFVAFSGEAAGCTVLREDEYNEEKLVESVRRGVGADVVVDFTISGISEEAAELLGSSYNPIDAVGMITRKMMLAVLMLETN